MRYRDAWQGADGIKNVIPRAGRKGEFPEKPGFSPYEVLQAMIVSPVVEIGCGYGRLAPAFFHERYTGLDPNEAAIERARWEHPAYQFDVLAGYTFPVSEAKLAYTVAMHIPDDEYQDFVEELCNTTTHQIVIAEILGRHLRKELTEKDEGISHATFGRDLLDHENEFLKHNWGLAEMKQFPYPGKGNFSFLNFKPGLDDAA